MKRVAFSSSSKALIASWALVCGLGVSCSSSQSDEENLDVAVGETAAGNAEAGQEAYADNQIALAGGENNVTNDNLTVGIDPGGENQAMEEDNAELPTEGNMAEANAAGEDIANIADSGEGNVLADAGADPDLTADQGQEAMESVINDSNTALPTDNQFPIANEVAGGNEITETAGEMPVNDVMPDEAAEAMPADAMAGGEMGGAEAALPPPATVEGSSLPEMGAKLTYVVKKGDTLGDIAQHIYGDKSKWRDLARWSGFSNPHLIFPGNLVYYQYTEQSAAFAQQYENQPKSEVVVQAGDSLSGIAERVYGDPTHWVIIWRHNGHIANPDRIEVGQVVTYPQQGYLSVEHNTEDSKVDNNSNTEREVETADQDEQAAEQATNQEVTQQIKPTLPSTVAAEQEAA